MAKKGFKATHIPAYARQFAIRSFEKIEHLQKDAQSQGYQLSDFYSAVGDQVPKSCRSPDYRLHATVMCPKGHIRKTRLKNIKFQHSCGICYKLVKKKLNPKDRVSLLQKNIENLGFILDDTLEDKKYQSRIFLFCHKNDETGNIHGTFNSSYRAIQNKTATCPKCRTKKSGTAKPYEQLKKEFSDLGWNLLLPESEYQGVGTAKKKNYAMALCPNEHTERKTISQFIAGSQCNQCLSLMISRGESLARELVEQIFDQPFPKSSPDFLGLQHFDGYNEDLKLAIEYDGPYHFVEFLDKHGDKIQNTIERDLKKNQICKDNQITLVRIRFLDKTNQLELWKTHLKEAFSKSGIHVSDQVLNTLNLDEAFEKINTHTSLLRIQHIEQNFSVICLEPIWRGVDYKYLWRCGFCQKEFRTSCTSFRPTRCKGCYDCKVDMGRTGHIKTLTEEGRRGLLSDLERVVHHAGFILNDSEWKGSEACYYSLTCTTCQETKEHKAISINNWHRNDWYKENKPGCRSCRGLEELKPFIAKKEVICLSQTYVDNHTYLDFQCSKGHIWSEKPLHLKMNTGWCRLCKST